MFLVGPNKELNEVRDRILGKNLLSKSVRYFWKFREKKHAKVCCTTNKFGLINSNSKVESSAMVTRGFLDEVKKDGNCSERPWCDHCKHPGHIQETCWKIHGKLQNLKKKFGEVCELQVGISIQKQQSSSRSFTFTKEQINQLYELLKS